MNATASILEYVQTASTGKTREEDGSGFAAFFAELTVAETAAAREAESPRTLDDVKRDFYDYLSSLPISPGLSGTSIVVNVTESAFEKMLADPDYEQKMKDLCKRDLCDPQWTKMAAMGLAPAASVITIDADADEEYLASSMGSAVAASRGDRDSANSFWTNRSKRHREMLEILQEKSHQRRLATDDALARFVPGEFTGLGGMFIGTAGAASFFTEAATGS